MNISHSLPKTPTLHLTWNSSINGIDSLEDTAMNLSQILQRTWLNALDSLVFESMIYHRRLGASTRTPISPSTSTIPSKGSLEGLILPHLPRTIIITFIHSYINTRSIRSVLSQHVQRHSFILTPIKIGHID